MSVAPFARAGEAKRVSPPPARSERTGRAVFRNGGRDLLSVGLVANPNSYEVGAQFITARWRWGMIERDGLASAATIRFTLLAMAEPIFRGPENFYYGISLGFRYNFVQPGSRWQPYVSGGVGLGWIDSHANVFGAQGQDFTFNILTAVGVSYKVNEHWKFTSAPLSASFKRRANRSQPQPESLRAADRRDLLLLNE